MEQLQLFNMRKRYSFLVVGVFCMIFKDFPSQSYLVVMGTEANEEKWLGRVFLSFLVALYILFLGRLHI